MTTDTATGVLKPHNDRLFLHLIRAAGSMSKADLTRASGLSAQSSTVIVNRLVSEGLLQAGKAVRGRVGQPSTPYQLNPDGATSIGVKLGRRSLEVVSMSFDYRILERVIHRYDFPRVADLRGRINDTIATLLDHLTPTQRTRFVGIGLALPDALADWEDTIGAPTGTMADWRDTDLRGGIAAQFAVPVTALNDAAAACLAELKTGNPNTYASFVYIYVGTFIGGGIALGGRLFSGEGHAGAIGSMPAERAASGDTQQMIDTASLHHLESRTTTVGLSTSAYYNGAPLDAPTQAIFDSWLADAASTIATACVNAQALLHPQAILIDTSLSVPLKAQLLAAVQQATRRLDLRGLAQMTIGSGTAGVTARATGSGIAPFQAHFALDPPA
jgi:predicted NBD/HSP70 family sugar kinase